MSASTCMVVMYHYVRDSVATEFPDIRALPPALFEQQLDWLEREYRIIALRDLEDALNGVAPLPPDAALLTFDDGFIDHYETAFPTLQARKLSAVFFLAHDACGPSPRPLGVHQTHFLMAKLGAARFATAVLEECRLAAISGAGDVFGVDRWEERDERAIKHLLNYELPFEDADRVLDTLFTRHIGDPGAFARRLYLSPLMIGEMARAGMVFGYHTRSHRMLSRLSPSRQDEELRDGVSWIRELTGQERVSFCYPWGGAGTYTADTQRLLRDRGYSLAFNTIRRHVAVGTDGRFELPRLDTRDLPPYTGSEPDAVTAMVERE